MPTDKSTTMLRRDSPFVWIDDVSDRGGRATDGSRCRMSDSKTSLHFLAQRSFTTPDTAP
jgi:hypothetical protein